ncbi:polysaccharide deacetylase family protein [Mesorhizobium sp. L-8-3]|uniref:polysaccharide deacetylase family protein n=1 Tax=Mesorhizobium sp. L-8-3 TaxID=2744522 RepID=UPI001928023A|nr:polysaccharide deacetylase family protein [Mesorhizobium sp. L-8-3]BCH21434.1 polysaccharide deacetylase [Mesorhizobium sp. L-8-3]
MSVFADVDAELENWRRESMRPRFWLRDDDAAAPDPRLDRLIGLVRRFDVPLLLAVVPALAGAPLADRLAGEPLVTPCVHGFAHENHMAEGEKKVELGGRAADEVLAELREGRRRLSELFPGSLSDILVPPWNRIAPDVAARIHECGFSAVSTASWHRTGTSLPELNTQVDIMDWAGGRVGHRLDAVAAELRRRLEQARARGGVPIGILSHHLVHDETAWATLASVIGYLKIERGLDFETAESLIRDRDW